MLLGRGLRGEGLLDAHQHLVQRQREGMHFQAGVRDRHTAGEVTAGDLGGRGLDILQGLEGAVGHVAAQAHAHEHHESPDQDDDQRHLVHRAIHPGQGEGDVHAAAVRAGVDHRDHTPPALGGVQDREGLAPARDDLVIGQVREGQLGGRVDVVVDDLVAVVADLDRVLHRGVRGRGCRVAVVGQLVLREREHLAGARVQVVVDRLDQRAVEQEEREASGDDDADDQQQGDERDDPGPQGHGPFCAQGRQRQIVSGSRRRAARSRCRAWCGSSARRSRRSCGAGRRCRTPRCRPHRTSRSPTRGPGSGSWRPRDRR